MTRSVLLSYKKRITAFNGLEGLLIPPEPYQKSWGSGSVPISGANLLHDAHSPQSTHLNLFCFVFYTKSLALVLSLTATRSFLAASIRQKLVRQNQQFAASISG